MAFNSLIIMVSIGVGMVSVHAPLAQELLCYQSRTAETSKHKIQRDFACSYSCLMFASVQMSAVLSWQIFSSIHLRLGSAPPTAYYLCYRIQFVQDSSSIRCTWGFVFHHLWQSRFVPKRSILCTVKLSLSLVATTQNLDQQHVFPVLLAISPSCQVCRVFVCMENLHKPKNLSRPSSTRESYQAFVCPSDDICAKGILSGFGFCVTDSYFNLVELSALPTRRPLPESNISL